MVAHAPLVAVGLLDIGVGFLEHVGRTGSERVVDTSLVTTHHMLDSFVRSKIHGVRRTYRAMRLVN